VSEPLRSAAWLSTAEIRELRASLLSFISNPNSHLPLTYRQGLYLAHLTRSHITWREYWVPGE